MTDPTKATQREALALGWLSAELAHRADVWVDNASEWFPQPPEWLELWEQALAATAEDRDGSFGVPPPAPDRYGRDKIPLDQLADGDANAT